ncbi:MAG: hypothetical protein HUJ94_06065 [Bacteroidales bacterium]|nr:hypothetical protein [Bacteroidales bacterium]
MERQNKKKLYPLLFGDEVLARDWGRESWKLADLGVVDSKVRGGWLGGNTISDIMETYMEKISGEDVFSWCGRQFPLMVKRLDIEGELPLRVAPDDVIARERYDALGGARAWLVLEADENAKVWLGMASEIDATEAYALNLTGALKSAMNSFKPAAGDLIHILPCQVYGAVGRLSVLEISESSGLEFELAEDFEEVLDFIELNACSKGQVSSDACSASRGLIESEEFNLESIRTSEATLISSREDSCFRLFACVSGKAQIGGTPVTPGEVVLVPADCHDFTLEPEGEITLLMAQVRREWADGYINPDTEAFLEGEDYEGLDTDREEEPELLK